MVINNNNHKIKIDEQKNKEPLSDVERQIKRQNDQLDEILALSTQTGKPKYFLFSIQIEQMGAKVIDDMNKQRERLKSTSDRLGEVEKDVHKSESLLKKMLRRWFW